ncbi:MFS general substrate transporter [Vararia minispora EC-137]|uniref:MFS general substrate transporter n=1 Tax=Vararia minispora EC-137 TaxID=1314806 RepID=A0ACB8Q898_9AGAM|nr:MFS general substrate transporter [Vararia minispora EC-137]
MSSARRNSRSSVEAEKDIEKAEMDAKVECDEAEYVVDRDAERRLVRRIDMRIVPTTMLIYLLCFLDRSNVGNAKLLNSSTGDSLVQSTHITNSQYLTALMIFIVAYTIFETPSNYMLKRFRPSRWLALLMCSWGALTMILGSVSNFGGIVAVRFLLGAFEAGLFPGMVYYLTFWYTPRERAVRIALILACATLAGAFGGAIAYGVGHMNGVGGLEGWRWLFILEGIPSCLYAVIIIFILPDFPETERWLTEAERELAIKRLHGDRSIGHASLSWAEARDTLFDWRLYLHYLVYISISVPFSSISLFSPSIVAGLGYEGLSAQLWTVPPYAIAFVVTVVTAFLSDRYEARSIGAGVSLVVSGVAYIVQGALPPTAFNARFGMLVISTSFAFASIPPLLSWITGNLRSTAAATLAVPLNVSIGQFGQIVGVYIYKSGEAPGYPTGHYTNASFCLLGALVVVLLRIVYVRRNRVLAEGERPWRL